MTLLSIGPRDPQPPDLRAMHTPPRNLLVLLCLLLPVWCPAAAWAQESPSVPATEPLAELDGRSALIIRFDAEVDGTGSTGARADAGADTSAGASADMRADAGADTRAGASTGAEAYLPRVTRALETGWVSSAGADALAVGPLSLRGSSPSERSLRDDATSAFESLGTVADWDALRTAAEKAEVALVLVIGISSAPVSPAQLTSLAQRMARLRIRHVILEGVRDAGEKAASALREAVEGLKEAGKNGLWIAATSEDAPSSESSLDGIVVAPLTDLASDDPTAGDAYIASARRAASSSVPLITSFALTNDAAPLDTKLLFLSGSLLITTTLPASDALPLWTRIAAFRQRHPAVSMGEQEDLTNTVYSFARTYARGGVRDAMIAAFDVTGRTTINVSRIFPDNALLRDAVTGETAFVSFGMATFDSDPSGVLLIEEAF